MIHVSLQVKLHLSKKIKTLKYLPLFDYIQLLSSKIQSRIQSFRSFRITRQLKSIAKELNVPVLALSQLSRAVEQRDTNLFCDLKSFHEQDADVVMFVLEEYYLEKA